MSATEWLPIDSAPQDGTRVRVGHELDPQSLKLETPFTTTGIYQDGRWCCSTAFTCIDMMLRWQPTHWLPEQAA